MTSPRICRRWASTHRVVGPATHAPIPGLACWCSSLVWGKSACEAAVWQVSDSQPIIMCGVISDGGAEGHLRTEATTTPTTAPGPASPGPCTPCAASSSPGRGRLWWHVRTWPATGSGPGVPGLSQQGHRTGLKGSVAQPRGPSWRVLSRLRPQQRPTWGEANVALDRRHGNPRGLIHDAVGGGVRVVDGAGIRAHRRGSPRRGIYRPDACTVSRRGVATTSPPV